MADSKLPRALGGPPIEQAGMRKASWKFLTVDQQNHLEELGPRRPLALLRLSEDAGPEAYFDAKSTDLEATCEAARTELHYYKQVTEKVTMTHENYQEATRELKHTIESAETELQVIKRQKKHIVQDIDEMAAPIAKFRASWVSLLLDKVALASTPLKKTKKNFNQSKFRDDMLAFYGAEKIVDNVKYQYCVVSGMWFPEVRGKTQIRAAHIVPKVLSGPELNELFEVGETMLHEARNSLPLFAAIERALDDGDIAIIPHEMDGARVLSLKMELVNEGIKNQTYAGSGPNAPRWNSLDGKVLRFLSTEEVAEAQCTLPPTTRDRLLKNGKTPEVVAANRPAQRYLYFRCVATYLTAKRKCSENPNLSPWIQRYEKGSRTMWVTPGRYARMSLLSELAFIAGDIWLPEAKIIFADDGGNDKPTTKKEWDTDKVYALGLKKKLLAHEELGDEEDKDSDEEDDEDDY
ncbi:hypothetical protein BP6252_00456 [Coleophoma cylindrospora]|uniref:HNH nuclease domain-containing protein n=1 Tax=Coleophoma cylindrospora TaxID=1849047 RepID=A0A3D8SQF5_9HELO|nr:hypothetical protein BP6252_00456 [Coleophoma cylindrospora]